MGDKTNQVAGRARPQPLPVPSPVRASVMSQPSGSQADNMSMQYAASPAALAPLSSTASPMSVAGSTPSLANLMARAQEPAICRVATPLATPLGTPAVTAPALANSDSAAPKAIDIRLDPAAPWKALVDSKLPMSDVSIELYGVDLSAFFELDDGFMSLAKASGRVRVGLLTDLLKPQYAQAFHAQMESELETDLAYVESKLMESWVDDDDESAVLGRVRWWSGAGDARDSNGVLYFDRFLGRLESDQYYTDYGVTESKRASYLSLLHEEIEDNAGDLVDLIANHSERFGGYRPTTLFPSVSAKTDSSSLLVERVTNQLLDRMVGFTSGADEQGMVGMVTALPGPLQARVLQDLMTRTSETRLKIFSRTGEQDGEGMLHFLFEDLEVEDKRRMGDNLREKGVLNADAVESLIEGRTWAGRNLPWSTHHGKNAAMFWADKVNNSDNALTTGVSATMGGFASLWTPETAGTTIVVLATANPSGVIGSTVARAPLIVQKGLLVAGTGLGAYQATTATMAATSGKDNDGNTLSGGERVGKAIEAVSAVLMLGAGFATAAKLSPRMPQGGSKMALPPGPKQPLELPGAGGTSGEQRVAWRVVGETAEGEITAVGLHHESGELAVVNINKHTGDGSFFTPKFGRINIVGGQPVTPRPALGPGGTAGGGTGGAGGAGVALGSDTSLLPAGASLPPATGTSPTALAQRAPQGALAAGPGPVNTPLKPVNPAPLALGSPPALRMLQAPQYVDIGGELQQHINSAIGNEAPGLIWTVAPDGTAFTLTPPGLRAMPLHMPDGFVPPGEIFRGLTPQPTLVGPLREGFSPFDIFPPPNARTTSTLAQVRRTFGQGALRGKPGVDFVGEQHAGLTEQPLDLPELITKSGQAGAGVRETDVLARIRGGYLNGEVKNYLRFVDGPAHTVNQVSPNAQLRGELWRDAMIPYYYPDQQPVWIFLGAPPSAVLATELAQANIPWMMYSDAVPYMGGLLP